MSEPVPPNVVVNVDAAVKLTTALALPATAVTLLGVAMTATGAAGDKLPTVLAAAPVPPLFIAVTENVYAVPLVNPVMVIGELVPVAVRPPGLAVTV